MKTTEITSLTNDIFTFTSYELSNVTNALSKSHDDHANYASYYKPFIHIQSCKSLDVYECEAMGSRIPNTHCPSIRSDRRLREL